MKISYKGVEFFLRNTVTEIENNINIYEVPNGATITENTGQRFQVIPIQGFAVGKNREMTRDQLLNACRETTPGLLNHPELGLLNVYARKITVSTRYNEQNIVHFSLEFVEATSENSLFPLLDKLVEFAKEAKKLREKYTGYFLQGFSLLSLPEQTLKEALRGVLRLASVVSMAQEKNLAKDAFETLEGAANRFLGLFHKKNKETSTDDDLFLTDKLRADKETKGPEGELKKLLFTTISTLIIEKTADRISKGLVLKKEQKDRFVSLCMELRDTNTQDFFKLSQFVHLAKNFPFKKGKKIKGYEESALELIYRGGGSLEDVTRFLEANQLSNPFSISETVQVEYA
jgi:hypothetical protein